MFTIRSKVRANMDKDSAIHSLQFNTILIPIMSFMSGF